MHFSHLTLNTDAIKQFNLGLVYRLICENAPISRIQLSEKTHLAPATITKIVRDLIAEHWIEEVEHQQSTGGRPAVSIVPAYASHQIIAVHLSRSRLNLALYDLGAQCLATAQFDCDPTLTIHELEALLIAHLKTFKQQHQDKIKRLLAISLILPGVVEAKTLRYSPYFNLRAPWEIGKNLETQFNVPIFVENNVKSFALAESFFKRDHADFIFVRTDHGVGAGVIINHALMQNSKQTNSEIGHIQIDHLGKRCHCGLSGCLETRIGKQALIEQAKQKIDAGHQSTMTINALEQLQFEALCAAVKQNDDLAQKILKSACHDLGKVLAMLVNVFNPQSIVIAGTLAKCSDLTLPAIEKAVHHFALPQFTAKLKIQCASAKNQSTMGAFSLVKSALLNGQISFYLCGLERLV